MSHTNDVTIWCDAEGCSEWAQASTDDTLPQVRAKLKRVGWTRKGGKDYCPDDSKEKS